MKEFSDIKLVISDFDGIFTDGKLTVYSDGSCSKQIDYKDIMAIAILLKKGIKFAVISGETSAAIDILKQKFPEIDVFQNIRKKIDILNNLLAKYGINKENVIYIRDDINDRECLEYVKNPVTVNNAHFSIKEITNICITKADGGQGAFREVIDALL
ncbi:MAG: HAD hydrolase family protein [Candidatus Gastranaerophilales bacterium]|nr:HAD hydrolase family protein [Candidatus Gastranaerophilales bacterium]